MLSGYTITKEVDRGSERLLFAGHRESDRTPVLIKTVTPAVPFVKAVKELHQEYELLTKLSGLSGIVKTYALEAQGDRPILIFEDSGGALLKHILSTTHLPLLSVLQIAMSLTTTLGELHQNKLIHKSIHPAHILVNLQTYAAQFIDLSQVSSMPKEMTPQMPLLLSDSSIPYLSPEQTGRMHRILDHRSDFYSLGVLLYEMLTGRVPFEGEDPLAVIYAHLTHRPVSPKELQPDVPQTLADIVMKLLAKMPEDRYQTAAGLYIDLETCLHQLQTQGTVTHFLPGRSDQVEQLLISQKLYGRDREIDLLRAALERVSQGKTELIMVSGSPGIGKTALVSALSKSVTRLKGYFLQGKFVQQNQHIPYSAILEAFRFLIQYLLMESDEVIQGWKNRLLEALGVHAQVFIEVLPELETLIGKQPPAPSLDLIASRQRFLRCFQSMIEVFANPSHPVVLFLDDLHWADGASLKLFQTLVSNRDQSLLLVAAYRENEVDEFHPLMHTLKEIQNTQTPLQILSLGPLALSSVSALIADTLHCTTEHSASLAELVYEKTAGNPFFVQRFLLRLVEEHLLHFERGTGWVWEREAIKGLPSTENVIDLLITKIRQLSRPIQTMLAMAACIGYRFDLQTLALITGYTEEDTVTSVRMCVEEYLLIPSEVGVYSFIHDRVHQAAYALIPEARKGGLHAHIGRLLLHRMSGEVPPEEKLFALVDHLNLGAAMIIQQTERDTCAQWNLLAGQRAKKAAAYRSAFHYFQAGTAFLLPTPALHPLDEQCRAESWHRQYELMLALTTGAAEAACLSTDFPAMEHWASLGLRHAKTLLDKITLYETKIHTCIAQGEFREAIEIALDVLKYLGITFPDHIEESYVIAMLRETQTALEKLCDRTPGSASHPEQYTWISHLLTLPEMTDPQQLAALRIIVSIIYALHNAQPPLFPLFVCQMVSSLRYGRAPETAFACILYGKVLCEKLQEIDLAYHLAQVALQLQESGEGARYTARTILGAYMFIFPWKIPLHQTLTPLRENYHTSLILGDPEFSALSATVYCTHTYFSGAALGPLEREIEMYSQRLKELKQEPTMHILAIYHQTILNLLNPSAHPSRLVGESYHEEMMLPRHRAVKNERTLLPLYFNKMVLCYLFAEYPQAAEYAVMAEQHLERAKGWTIAALFYLYDSLIRLMVWPDTVPAQEQILQKVAANQAQLAIWAAHAPMNHRHKWYLVEAERDRVLQQEEEARVAYDNAIALAREQGYLQEAALANELAAKFYDALGKYSIATEHMHEACADYLRWGAIAKVQHLEKQYPQYLTQSASNPDIAERMPQQSPRMREDADMPLDVQTLFKAVRELSQEIEWDKLLAKLLAIAIENAGAQKGVFLLEQAGHLQIVAQQPVEPSATPVAYPLPLESSESVSPAIVQYVKHTGETVILHDTRTEHAFTADPYLQKHQPLSVLCIPVLKQATLLGILYLENNLLTHVFTSQRLEVLSILTAQMTISLENAQLWAAMQQEISARRQAEESLQRAFTEIEQLKEHLEAENVYLQEEIKEAYNFENIIGRSEALQYVLFKIQQVAPTDMPVLILGETGVGKELFARAIHHRSRRSDRPLMKVDCATLPAHLIESELFGHEKGAFTGAITKRIGRFELAHGGTIFLDEIGELPVELQVKLLRVLQDGEFERLGSSRTLTVDVRVIAATNRNLQEEIRRGRFREDLYYRLNVYPLSIPPLRQRKEDIPLLVHAFVQKSAKKLVKRIETIPQKTMDALQHYPWPGNVRELANVIDRAVINTQGSTLRLLEKLEVQQASETVSPQKTLEELEREYILHVLQQTNWRIEGAQGAAAILGLHHSTLRGRMRKLGIHKPAL